MGDWGYLHPSYSAVVSHSQARTLNVGEGNATCLLQAANAHSVLHLLLANKAVDDLTLRAAEDHSADLVVVAIEDLHLAVAG